MYESMQAERPQRIGNPGHSPALRYEVLLSEAVASAGHAGTTPERIAICFKALGELLPHLGVFQRVVKLIRDELYAAVYSDEYTAGSGRSKGSQRPQARPERLPYFIIAKRYMQKRKEETSKLEAEIASLKEQLYTCEAEQEKASSAVEAYRHDLKDRDAKLHKLGSELRSRAGETERLQKMVGQHQRAQDRLRQEAEYRMFTLRGTLASLNEENTDLQTYKDTHSKIQEVLARPDSHAHLDVTSPPASTEAQLSQHLQTAQLLREQLMQMQNSLLDEYDTFLNSQVAVMADPQATEVHAMIRDQQQIFSQNIAAIQNELSLLHTHSVALTSRQEQLASIRDNHPGDHEAIVVPSHPLSPLVAQEQPCSKFAAMLSTSSDGGRTFYPLKDAKLCLSCGEKTVICPHKSFSHETVTQLPLRSTHLKITRPILRVLGAEPLQDNRTAVAERVKPVRQLSHSQGLHNTQPDFRKIWGHFKTRFAVERSVPRKLSPERLLLLVHQFYGRVLLEDERITSSLAPGEEDRVPALLDSLYSFMQDRYLLPEVIPMATHDLLSALTQHHLLCKDFLVLAHIFCGNLDGAAFRYLLLLASLVDPLPWHSMKEFSSWVALLYPNLQEEDAEQLTMNFIAHSSNRVSRHLVMEFLIWLVLRHREPHILELEHKLQDHPCKRPGSMLEVEFAEAMDSLVPLLPDLLCRRLFMQSLAQLQEVGQGAGQGAGQTKRETVPIRRLAYIAAYLSLLRATPSLLPELQQLVHRTAMVAQPGPQQHAPAREAEPALHTLDTVRAMACRMSS